MGDQTYTSESKDQFGSKSISVMKGKGAGASIDLGDGNRQFSTQYRETFTNKLDENSMLGREGTKMGILRA
jgi:hypothetical protein